MRGLLILVLAVVLIAGCVQTQQPQQPAAPQENVSQGETQQPALPAQPEQPAQPIDWGTPDYGAKSLYGYTKGEAENWNGDAFLVKVYSGDAEGGKSGVWIFDYYSPKAGKVLSVTAKGTVLSKEEKSGSYTDSQRIGSWSTDSMNAWVIAYNHDGKPYLDAHPDAIVSFELYKPSDAGLRWKLDYDSGGLVKYVNGLALGMIG